MSSVKFLAKLSLIASLVSASSFIYAQGADKKAAVDALMGTMGVAKMADNMGKRMQEDVSSSIPAVLEDILTKDKNMSIEQKKALVPKLQKVMPTMKSKVGTVFVSPNFKQGFISEQAGQYEKSYSTEDINALNSFFKTPTGVKFLTEQGKIAQGTIINLQNKFMPIAIEELKKVAQQEITKAVNTK